MENISYNDILYFCIIWFSFALISGFMSKKRNKGYMFGFFIGCVFGIFGIILILLFPKKDKKKYLSHEADTLNSRLKYYKLKEEFKEYKNKQVQVK